MVSEWLVIREETPRGKPGAQLADVYVLAAGKLIRETGHNQDTSVYKGSYTLRWRR